MRLDYQYAREETVVLELVKHPEKPIYARRERQGSSNSCSIWVKVFFGLKSVRDLGCNHSNFPGRY